MKNIKEIQATDIWNKTKTNDLKSFILEHTKKQSNEQKLRTELLSIKYKLEDYIENDNYRNKLMISDFVKMYLKTFNVTQKKLAELFEMKDSNLYKYLNGERKLNSDIVLKLSSFSHTNPEHWLRLQIKNELMEIKKEKRNIEKYQKYDYKNLVTIQAEKNLLHSK